MRYVFDIDNTILFTDKSYNIQSVNKKLIKKINALYKKGHTIIIWTGRHWDKLQLTVEQLETSGLNYTTLLMAKPAADFYIDDKSMKPEEFNELK